MGLLLTVLMTALFATNYIDDMPFDIQTKIMDMSKTEWVLSVDDLDQNKYNKYSELMIRKDMQTKDKVKHDSIIELVRKLSLSKVTRLFAIQKVHDAVHDALKYQDLFDFDLTELFSNLTLNESKTQLEYPIIYDWDKDEFISNPLYEPHDWEYSDDEEEDN